MHILHYLLFDVFNRLIPKDAIEIMLNECYVVISFYVLKNTF